MLRILCGICRAWAAHAQSLLFREVSVKRLHQHFLVLLRSNPNIGRYIHVLNVTDCTTPQDGYIGGLLDSMDASLAQTMPNLYTLTISHRMVNRPNPALSWGGISRLQLAFCAFATTDTMLAFITSFPRLDSLDMFQCSTLDVASASRTSKRCSAVEMPPWHFKYLALGEFPQNGLLDWLIAEPAELTVDHLRILSLAPDASAFNALLAKTGPSIQHLEVPGMHRWGHAAGECDWLSKRLLPGLNSPAGVPLSIRACTSLTALSFSERSSYDLGRGFVAVLSQVASAHLSTISFHIHLSSRYYDIPWEGVENILTTDIFGSLRAVVFNVWGAVDVGAYGDAIVLMQDRLPTVSALGLLRFSPAEEIRKSCISLPRDENVRPVRKRFSTRISGWIGRRREPSFVALSTPA
jgi:hypothetical protein